MGLGQAIKKSDRFWVGLINRSIGGIIRHRLWVLIAIAITTGLMIASSVRVDFDNSMEIWFMEDDPDLVTYQAFLDRFENDAAIVVAFETDRVFTTANLELIGRLSDRFGELDGVIAVQSLTAIDEIRAVDDGVEIATLIETIPRDAGALAALERHVLANDLYTGNVVSEDGKAAAIVVEVERAEGNATEAAVSLLDEIKIILAEETPAGGPRYYIGGQPALDAAILEYTRRDSALTSPVMAIMIVLIVFFLFRNLSSVIFPALVAGLSVAWTFGFMGIAGYQMNIVTAVLMPLIMAMSIADAVHILVQYHETLATKSDKHEALVETFRHIFAPCLVTTLTTCAGLLSLTISDLMPLRMMGILGSLGVFLALVFTMLLGPALLSYLPPPRARRLDAYQGGIIGRSLAFLGRAATRRPRAIIAASVGLVVVAVAGIAQLGVSVNMLDYFTEDSEVRISHEFIDERLGGTTTMEFMLEGAEPGAFKDPALLARIELLEEEVAALPGVVGVYSLNDYLKEMNRVMKGGDPEQERIPESRALVAQYLLLLENSDQIFRFQEGDYQTARVSARLRTAMVPQTVARVGEMERFIAETFDGHAEATATGSIKLMSSMLEYLLKSEIQSFSLAFVTIMVFMLVLLRSVRLGLASSIPNLLPILLTLGFMGYVGIALDVGTVMIASIAIGLAVDVSVHFLWRFKSEEAAGHTVEQAIQLTMIGTGRAIASTTVILFLGFATLLLASFRPLIYFGALTGVTVLCAMVADPTILPATLVLLPGRSSRRIAAQQTPTAQAVGSNPPLVHPPGSR